MRHKSDQNTQKYKARCDPTFVNFHKSMEKYEARCDRGAAHESRHIAGLPSFEGGGGALPEYPSREG